MNTHFIQELNYHSNPNYNTYLNGSKYFSEKDNLKIKEIIDRIDSSIDFLISSNHKNSVNEFRKLARQDLNELSVILNDLSGNDAELNESLNTILTEAVKYTEKFIEFSSQNNDYVRSKNISVIKEKEEQITELKLNGYLKLQMPQSKEFLKFCDEQLNLYRDKYKDQDDWRGANALDPRSAEYGMIADFIEKEKILAIISEYKNMNMETLYAAVDYSHNRQKWFRNNHDYNYLAPTNYYHFDADADVAKMMIYLTDVKEGDGAFRFVKGSNNMARSMFLVYIYYAVDYHISNKYCKPENLYGRGLFLYRKDLLMKFPVPFRGTTHFGDDLTAESFLSKYLVENTVTFQEKRGSVILFDGFRGIHAGGNPVSGERLAVQVAFRRKPDVVKKSFSLFKN